MVLLIRNGRRRLVVWLIVTRMRRVLGKLIVFVVFLMFGLMIIGMPWMMIWLIMMMFTMCLRLRMTKMTMELWWRDGSRNRSWLQSNIIFLDDNHVITAILLHNDSGNVVFIVSSKRIIKPSD